MTVRYVTYGSEAYDYNRSREIYANVPARETEVREQRRTRERTRTRRAAKTKSSFKLMPAVVVALALGMIVLNILSYALLAEISKTTTAAEDEYIQLQEERARLLVKYEQTFNMSELEDYAINTMGMIRASSGQTVELGSLKSDKSVVYTYEEEDNGNIITDMVNLVSSLLAYFGQ